MDHLDELRVATASSLPLNGLAPRTYARDHATFEVLSSQCGLKVPERQGRRPVVGRVCFDTASG